MSAPFYQVPMDEWPASQQLAGERLHLKMVQVTHKLLWAYLVEVKAALMEKGYRGDNDELTTIGFSRVRMLTADKWRAVMRRWRTSLELARWAGGMLGLATAAREHAHFFAVDPVDAQVEERLVETAVDWAKKGWPYGRLVPLASDVNDILTKLEKHIYDDSLTLSQRIWRLDQTSLAGIQNTLYQGFANGKTVWQIALDLEQYLGAKQECPRWTEERLGLSPEQIAAGDETGLIRGDACAGQGVAYRALRLAVNEIQTAMQAVLRERRNASPWVTGERLFLNDLRGDVVYNCECERIAGYPPERISKVLPLGSVILPLHPWCMCYVLPVYMTDEEARKRWDDWQRGEPWPEMDNYLSELGLGIPPTLPMRPPSGPAWLGDKRWVWWLLLLILADEYRRWMEADEDETDAALGWPPEGEE